MSQQQNLLNTIRAGMANGEHQTATINAGWSALFLGAFYFFISSFCRGWNFY